jgi:3-hydroxyisobutyrate dehydrogenase-like beta-hydroxyacid dehydrogenase
MKVGFIGLGRMGQAMAARLLAAGHDLTLYNRTPGKLQGLLQLGAHTAGSIAAAARFDGLVLTMLADDSALKAVTQGEGGLLATLPVGGIHVAMGTHDLELVRALAAAHADAGQILLSAPVLGRPDTVAAGNCGILAAGDAAALGRCKPLFEAIAARVLTVGSDPGSAAAMKLANNFLLACAIEAIGEAYSLVQKCGVERPAFHELITKGLFACPAYNIYSKIIADEAWDTVGFTATLALKDLGLAMAAGKASGVPLPSATICRDRLLSAIARGDGERDWSVMALEQARASGLG